MSQFKAWKCEDSLRDLIPAIKVALTIQEIEKHDRSRIGEFMDAAREAANGKGMETMDFLALDFGLSDYVIAELRADLSESERTSAIQEIEELQERLKIVSIDGRTYCKAQPINGYDDFGAIAFFYSALKDKKNYFSRLEYQDLRKCRMHIAGHDDKYQGY